MFQMGSVKNTALEKSTKTAYHDWSTPMQAYYDASAIPNNPPVFFTPSASHAIASPPYVWGSQHLIRPSGTLIQYPTIHPHGHNVNPNLGGEQSAAPLSRVTEGIPKGKGQSVPPVSILTERRVPNGSQGQNSAKKCKRSSENLIIVGESGESGLAISDLGKDNMSKSEETECDTLSNRSDEDTSQNEFDDISLYTSDEDTCNESDEDASDEDTACEDPEWKVVNKKRELHSLTLKLKKIAEECEDISEKNSLIKEKLINLLGKEQMLPLENLEAKFLDSCNGDSKNERQDSSRESDNLLPESGYLLCNQESC